MHVGCQHEVHDAVSGLELPLEAVANFLLGADLRRSDVEQTEIAGEGHDSMVRHHGQGVDAIGRLYISHAIVGLAVL